MLVDAHGWDAVTMTLLADALGTRVSTLYNHVAGLAELRAELQVRCMTELSQRLRAAAMGHAGVDGVTRMARVLREFAAARPHRFAAITRAPLDRARFRAAALGATEALFAMVGSCGVPEERTLQTALAVFSALSGFVSLEAGGFFGSLEDLEIGGRRVESLDDVYAQVVRGAVLAALSAVDVSS